MPHSLLTQEDIESYDQDGVFVARELFAEFVELLHAGKDRYLSIPGPYAVENPHDHEAGRSFAAPDRR